MVIHSDNDKVGSVVLNHICIVHFDQIGMIQMVPDSSFLKTLVNRYTFGKNFHGNLARNCMVNG